VAWIDVSVHPDYRGSDAVHRLLQHAEEYFLKRGRAYLQVRCCGKVEKLEGLYDLLVREAFLPVLVLGGIVRYRMYNWFGSDFMKKAAQLEAYIERVQTIEDWEDERLQAFLRTGVNLPRDCFDVEFCRFYVVNGQIQAALCAERVNDQTLFFHQLVFAPKCPKQIALLALLASLIRQAEKHKLEESAVLVVQSPLQSLLEGMRE
jgi:N-acetylglutamate synthase-like GNAT family acetyltransferase